MAQAKHDDNQVETMIAVLNTDGTTPTRLKIDPSTHILQVSDGSSGSDLGGDNAARDQNGVTVLLATGSNTSTPVPLYVDSNGQLLIQTT